MKKIEINEYKKQSKKKTINRIKVIAVAVIVVTIIVIASLYISNTGFREGFDKYVLRKEISTEDVKTIEINSEEAKHICAFDKYIGVLSKNILKLYNGNGLLEQSLDIKIGTPIMSTNNRFLVIAQKNEQKIYLINGNHIEWQKDLEGEIIKVLVNQNGYVAVMLSGTTYKTVIAIYNPDGKELFRTYISTTNAVDVDISNDNRYLAIAEVDAEGTIIQSNVKIISFEKAQSEPKNSVIYTYNAKAEDLILNIKYQDRNRLVCMYDKGVHVIVDEENKELFEINDKQDMFVDIDLDNTTIKVTEKNTGIFVSESQAQFINIINKKESMYTIEGIPKNLHTYGEKIALNLGEQILFINTNGWVVKKYITNKEMKDIVMNNNIAGIIYSDKIEIVNI